jgi:hypothetical protein
MKIMKPKKSVLLRVKRSYSMLWFLLVFAAIANVAIGQAPKDTKVRCIAFELYMQSSDEKEKDSVDFIRGYIDEHPGVGLKVYDLDKEPDASSRLDKIVAAYKLPKPKLPFLYGLNNTVSGISDVETWRQRILDLLQMEVFTRAGCSRCAQAKIFLPAFMADYPGLQVVVSEVTTNANANKRYSDIATSQRIGGVSFPGFWVGKQLVVGFDSDRATASRLDGVLKRWTYECVLAAPAKVPAAAPANRRLSLETRSLPSFRLVAYANPAIQDPPPLAIGPESQQPELGIGPDSDPPPIGLDSLSAEQSSTDGANEKDEVTVPWLGKLSVKQLGMPLFTLIIGLIDGFNPCAMWVLLFLLSVLVNLKERWKILAVAGTFVVVSGVAYFAFMAAWLNVLLFVGFLRWVQVLLAVLAIVVGSIHIKDFFALKKGISLSIPESAKPGIYSRVRRIVMAESLFAAIMGATVLAVLVNIIELLCTAGLPALYSQVLTLQNYPPWKNYAYLFLYIVAYMFDDSIMVAIVTITLGRKKLQENEGKWLKLISGLVIFILGLVLLFRPQWLE